MATSNCNTGPQLTEPYADAPATVTHGVAELLVVDDGHDSAVELDLTSSTASVRSSLYESVEENGRTYHRFHEGTYWGPNDEREQDRLDGIHHLVFHRTFGDQLHLAPLKNPHYVLDIGTGTGIWAIKFAEQYPTSNVIGTDLSLIQPEFVPANCQFEVDDAEDDWVYSQSFDFIHGRALFSCFRNPKAVFASALKSLNPGGYFEMQDPYLPMQFIDASGENTQLLRWNTLICEAAEKAGRSLSNTRNYKRLFEEVGFEDVVEKKFSWPLNQWPKGKRNKEIGMLSQMDISEGIEGWSMALYTRVLGWTQEEVEKFLEDVKVDIKNRNIHAYVVIYSVYGRKPVAAVSTHE